MNYKQLQALAKTLRAQGLIAKNFKLTQKATILKAEIERVTGQLTAATTKPATKKQEMTQEEFNVKFPPVYKKERLRQELEGVVAMRVLELKDLFQEQYEISDEKFDRYIHKFPNIFTVWENNKELCQMSY